LTMWRLCVSDPAIIKRTSKREEFCIPIPKLVYDFIVNYVADWIRLARSVVPDDVKVYFSLLSTLNRTVTDIAVMKYPALSLERRYEYYSVGGIKLLVKETVSVHPNFSYALELLKERVRDEELRTKTNYLLKLIEGVARIYTDPEHMLKQYEFEEEFLGYLELEREVEYRVVIPGDGTRRVSQRAAEKLRKLGLRPFSEHCKLEGVKLVCTEEYLLDPDAIVRLLEEL